VQKTLDGSVKNYEDMQLSMQAALLQSTGRNLRITFNMNPDMVIIRGAPGTGKSQVAKCLAHYFKQGIRLEVDTLRSMVITVDWKNQTEHMNVLSLAADLALGFYNLGYGPVIVVDTFSGNKLASFLTRIHAKNNNLEVHSFALITAPEVLKSRVESRPKDRFNDIQVCSKLNSDTSKYLLSFEKLIDNSLLTPEETAELILVQHLGLSTTLASQTDPPSSHALS
jgi:hypothetical protein